MRAVNALNRLEYKATGDPEILTRIAQYEMAFQMQTSVPELTDMTGEPAAPEPQSLASMTAVKNIR